MTYIVSGGGVKLYSLTHSPRQCAVFVEIEVEMPSFRADVQSYLQFVGLRRSVMIYSDLELVFKPYSADGLLLSGRGRPSVSLDHRMEDITQSRSFRWSSAVWTRTAVRSKSWSS